MRLTDYTDYSLRTLIYVAVHPDVLVTIQQIADAFGIPKNHLIKIVQGLGQNGFLHTVRGRAGGITLGRPAVEINIGDVVRATEPDFSLVECFHVNDNHCIITRVRVARRVGSRTPGVLRGTGHVHAAGPDRAARRAEPGAGRRRGGADAAVGQGQDTEGGPGRRLTHAQERLRHAGPVRAQTPPGVTRFDSRTRPGGARCCVTPPA